MTTQEEILAELGSHLSALCDVVQSAVDLYPPSYSEVADVHSKRTHACVVHDHMIRKAQEVLPSPTFQYLPRRGRNLFSFKDKLLIQFKKLKRNFKTSNYRTQQAVLFDLGQIPLTGMQISLPIINVGYVLRPFTLIAEGIFMTRNRGNLVDWVHRLDDAEDNFVELIPFTPHAPPATSPTQSRIKRTRISDSPAAAGGDDQS